MHDNDTKRGAMRVLVAGLSANVLNQLTDISAAGDGSLMAINDGDLHAQIAEKLGMDVRFDEEAIKQQAQRMQLQQPIRLGRRQPFEVEQGDAPRPGVHSVKTYNRPDPTDPTGLKTLPIKRAVPKRPAGMSARQAKKYAKAIRRANNEAGEEFIPVADIKLPPDKWPEFTDILDQPAVANPALRQLLTEPSVIDKANQE
jgi:uncharacterized protein (DUF1778 family)